MPGFGIRRGPTWTLGGQDVNRAHRWRINSIVGVESSEHVYAKEMSLPEMGFDEEAVTGASVDYKFPAKATFSDVEVTFYDFQGLWRQLISMYDAHWSPDSGLAVANAVMDDSIFELTDGQGETVDTLTLKNSWLKNISHSQLTYESSDIKTVTITLAFTWAEHK